jgi:hypothetical protein
LFVILSLTREELQKYQDRDVLIQAFGKGCRFDESVCKDLRHFEDADSDVKLAEHFCIIVEGACIYREEKNTEEWREC